MFKPYTMIKIMDITKKLYLCVFVSIIYLLFFSAPVSAEPISEEDFNDMKTFRQIEEEENEKENGNTDDNGNQGNDSGNSEGDSEEGSSSGSDSGQGYNSGASEGQEDDSGFSGHNEEHKDSDGQGNTEFDSESTAILESIYNAIIIQIFVTSLLFGACVCGFAIKFKF